MKEPIQSWKYNNHKLEAILPSYFFPSSLPASLPHPPILPLLPISPFFASFFTYYLLKNVV